MRKGKIPREYRWSTDRTNGERKRDPVVGDNLVVLEEGSLFQTVMRAQPFRCAGVAGGKNSMDFR